jgi:hypothetical protein
MQRLDGGSVVPAALRAGIVALGNFDGFHLGHQAVVGRAVERARAEGRPALVATFDPHPVRHFRPDTAPFRLTTLDQRERLFAEAGADAMIVFQFDTALAALSAVEFVGDRLLDTIGIGGVVTGEDFTFGKAKSGTVAVLAEADAAEEIQLDPSELRIDTFRASGAGGQHVNKTDSAVRITHIPTGTVVAMQEERSQHKNRAKAMKVLRARIYEAQRARLDATRSAERKGQVGTGDRSERIRTYNFPQGRVTDHRIGLTLHKIERVMLGEMDEIIEALMAEDEAARLAAAEG